MLNAKEGQTYICTKSDGPWWTEGKEYEVISNRYDELCLVDNDNCKWVINYLNNRRGIQFELKEDTTMNKLDVKEGQTYVCTKSGTPWWTKGKEYEVVTNNGKPCFIDDGGCKWVIQYWKYLGDYFRLKETQSKSETEKRKYTTFDVNKVILRAYNMYDNDAQRLAYIKGYFAK